MRFYELSVNKVYDSFLLNVLFINIKILIFLGSSHENYLTKRISFRISSISLMICALITHVSYSSGIISFILANDNLPIFKNLQGLIDYGGFQIHVPAQSNLKTILLVSTVKLSY